jgi:hypothetical protein
MSATSRSLARSLLPLLVALGLALSAHARLPDAPPALPASVASLVPDAQPQGGGELKWFGLSIYHGFLWSVDGTFSFDEPFALDLHYQRALEGKRIAERSVEEMRALGPPEADLARWGEALAALFPDVKKGDHIVGVHLPGRGARFFKNGRAIGDINEPRFARAFFGIWLDARTSRPDFRKQLLGQK